MDNSAYHTATQESLKKWKRVLSHKEKMLNIEKTMCSMYKLRKMLQKSKENVSDDLTSNQ